MRFKKQVFIIVVLLILAIGLIFTLFLHQRPKPSEEITPIPKEEVFSLPQVYLSSDSLEQGDTLFIRINSQSDVNKNQGKLGSEEINFFKLAGSKEWWGIIGINVKTKPGKYDLMIDSAEGNTFEQEIDITERKFPITELLVTKELEEKGYTQAKIIEDITTKENLILAQVLTIFTPRAYFSSAFIYPLKKIKDIGAFGNIRKSGDSGLQHLGVDIEAGIGTPVYAINDGVVRFSEGLNTYGKTLIIDHGFGIFSLYLHLNEFKFSAGEQVKQGDIIAFSGNTGYSIAPHLHFAVKVNGTAVDPLRFISTIEKEMLK